MKNRIINYDDLKIQTEFGFFPRQLEEWKHSIRWPIDISQTKIYFSYFHREIQRYDGRAHYGIDFRVPAHTSVYAPESGEIQIHRDEARRRQVGADFADAYLLSDESTVMYIIGHLDFKSIPQEFWNESDEFHKSKVSQGEKIGEVGEWPWKPIEPASLTDKIKDFFGYWNFERTLDHLHFETQIERNLKDVNFNPLFLLKEV